MADLVAGNFRLRFNNSRVEYSSNDGLTWSALAASTGTDWYSAEAAVHAAAVSQLTEATPIVVGVSNEGAILGANTVDAGAEGGALRGNSDTLWTLIHKGTVVQNLGTSKFAISFQGSVSPIAAGKVSYFGLTNAAASTRYLLLGVYQSVDGVNFTFFGYDGTAITATVNLGVADANVYTWRLISDGTTLTVARAAKGGGGAALASGTILTSALHYPAGVAAYPGFFNSVGTVGQQFFKALVSYVGP